MEERGRNFGNVGGEIDEGHLRKATWELRKGRGI